MKNVFSGIMYVSFAVTALLGVWMIVYARAANMSILGGVLAFLCGIAGFAILQSPASIMRAVAQGLVSIAIPLCTIVFNYTWRDAVTKGRYKKPESLRSVLRLSKRVS